VPRPALEVADVFRAHGPTWRKANVGHVSLEQLKVMSAIENCRTATLGGHVMRCDDCAHTLIAYNSCRNRHCPKCQGATAREWLAAREADLLPVPYFHVVFSLPMTLTEMPEEGSAFPEQSWTMESDRRPFKKRGDLIVGGGPVKRAGVMSWMSATSSA